jgi:hypothetical protein
VGEREAEKLEQEIPEFQIDELFEVPGVGTVCGGLVTQGFIVENMMLAVGPFDDGKFKAVNVSSIRRNKAACRSVCSKIMKYSSFLHIIFYYWEIFPLKLLILSLLLHMGTIAVFIE